MRILILNGNPDPARAGWEKYLDSFAEKKKAAGDEVIRRDLRDMDIRFCTGCWSCWYATPGLCAIKDDMVEIYPQMLAADLVIWASPLVLGNVSALTKKAQDRFIPLVHPYFALSHGEVHHRRRYPKDIDIGLIVERGESDTDEDLALVKRLHERLALNGRGGLALFQVAERQEARHEAIGA